LPGDLNKTGRPLLNSSIVTGIYSMNEITMIWIAAGFFLVIIFIMIANRVRNRAQVSHESIFNRLGFQEIENVENIGLLAEGNLFSQGHNSKVYHIYRGELDGVEITVFNYRFNTGKHSQVSGKSTHRCNCRTVFLVHNELLTLPELEVTPNNFWYKVARILNHSHSKLEPIDISSKRFFVRGRDTSEIRRFFNDEMVTHCDNLLGNGVHIEGHQDRFMYYVGYHYLPNDQLETNLFKVASICNHFCSS